jgi:hypothetical protein
MNILTVSLGEDADSPVLRIRKKSLTIVSIIQPHVTNNEDQLIQPACCIHLNQEQAKKLVDNILLVLNNR